jgi:hypothetical protein
MQMQKPKWILYVEGGEHVARLVSETSRLLLGSFNYNDRHNIQGI